MFILQVICVVIFVYGILSLAQDIVNEVTYKKVSHNMKIIVFVKELEENIEQFIVELYNIKKSNSYKQIVVIDLNRNDNIDKIKTRLLNSEVNVDVLSFEEGKEYMLNLLQNENISFL